MRGKAVGSLTSFATRLVLLVVLMVGLFVGAVVWTGWEHYRHNREQLGQFHVQLARAISTAVDRELASAAAVLRTLGASELLARNRLEEFHALAATVLASHPGASISVFSAAGERMLDTRVPFGARLPTVPIAQETGFTPQDLPRSSASSLKRAMQTGELTVSDLFLDLVSEKASVALHLPLPREKRGYTLSLTMTPAVFQELLAAQRVPQSAGASLSDGRGLTIARAVAGGPFVGERVSEDLARAMAAAREGFGEGRTREGREVLFAYSRSPVSGWTAAIGVSRASAFASVWGAMNRLVIASGALLLLGVAIAAWMARSVARPLDQLAAAAEAIERGAPVALAPMHGEFSRLSRALQAADRAIAEREQERTLRAQAEADRRAAEQTSAAKDRFLAMLSHELRNPLAALANCATLLKRGTAGDRSRLLDILTRQTAQLRVLVEDLLDLARITHGKLRMRIRATDASETARTVVAAYWARGREIALNVPHEVWVAADPARLTQIIGNLVENAVRYGGDRIVVETTSDAQFGVIAVEDNGRGIPADLLPDLFTAFAQGRSQATGQGLGLGLALVHQLATMQGGDVIVENGREGKGVRFQVRLPLTAVRPLKGRPQSAPGMPKRRILVIDDEPDLRQTTCRILELDGHEVAAAADAAEGLRKVAQFRPEVAFVDLRLDDMSGYEFARKARALPEGEAVTLVALTGYDQAEVREQALDAGFDLHFTKPASAETIYQALNHERNLA